MGTTSPKKLMFKTSTYASVPEYGKGLCLGIYQAQAAYGPGASAKNMDRLEKVARIAKERGVQLLSVLSRAICSWLHFEPQRSLKRCQAHCRTNCCGLLLYSTQRQSQCCSIPTFQLSYFQPLHILITCSMHIPTVQDMRNEIQTRGTIAATVSLSDLTVTSLFRPIISRTRCLLLTASPGTTG